MKVIKKVEIPVQTCRFCNTQVKLKPRDIKIYEYNDTDPIVLSYKHYYKCPVCHSLEKVFFKNELDEIENSIKYMNKQQVIFTNTNSNIATENL